MTVTVVVVTMAEAVIVISVTMAATPAAAATVTRTAAAVLRAAVMRAAVMRAAVAIIAVAKKRASTNLPRKEDALLQRLQLLLIDKQLHRHRRQYRRVEQAHLCQQKTRQLLPNRDTVHHHSSPELDDLGFTIQILKHEHRHRHRHRHRHKRKDRPQLDLLFLGQSPTLQPEPRHPITAATLAVCQPLLLHTPPIQSGGDWHNKNNKNSSCCYPGKLQDMAAVVVVVAAARQRLHSKQMNSYEGPKKKKKKRGWLSDYRLGNTYHWPTTTSNTNRNRNRNNSIHS